MSSTGETREDQRLLLLGRQDFHVQSINQMSGLVRWNVSYSHIQHLDVQALDSGIGVSGFLQGKHLDNADDVSGTPTVLHIFLRLFTELRGC